MSKCGGAQGAEMRTEVCYGSLRKSTEVDFRNMRKPFWRKGLGFTEVCLRKSGTEVYGSTEVSL